VEIAARVSDPLIQLIPICLARATDALDGDNG
jgi:hypothetical protein